MAPPNAVAAPAASLPVLQEPQETNPTAAANILIVDDDKLVRRFMGESLRSLGYQVHEVGDGAEALVLLDRHRFDLLLVDFAMPGMNGAEVAKAAQLKQPGLPVLIVSGYADSSALEGALGSTRQLRKPFDMAELGAAVTETLKRAS
jgi:CheY-like chemotaxis protein